MIPTLACQFALSAALHGYYDYSNQQLKAEAGYEPRGEAQLVSREQLDFEFCDAEPAQLSLRLVNDPEQPVHRAVAQLTWGDWQLQAGRLAPWQGSPELRQADLNTLILTPYATLFRPFQRGTTPELLAYGDPGRPALALNVKVGALGEFGIQWLNDVVKGEDPAANYNASSLQPATVLRWSYNNQDSPHEILFGSYDLNHSFYLSWASRLKIEQFELQVDSLTDWRRETLAEPRENVVTIYSVLGGSVTYNIDQWRGQFGYYSTRVKQPSDHSLRDRGANSAGIVFDDNADQAFLETKWRQPWGELATTIQRESGRFQRAVVNNGESASIWKEQWSAYLSLRLALAWSSRSARAPGDANSAGAGFPAMAARQVP